MKKEVFEKKIAEFFVLKKLFVADKLWPNFYEDLKEYFDNKFYVSDEKTATLNYGLAIIAIEIQALKNLFSKEQAERIEQYILANLDSMKSMKEDAVNEVKQYSKAWQDAINKADSNPIHAVSARLSKRLKNESLENSSTESILETTLIALNLSSSLGEWEKIKNMYNIVQEKVDCSYSKNEKTKDETKINTIIKNAFRWISIPFLFVFARPIATMLVELQSWFISTDSFYYTKIVPLIVSFVEGFLIIILPAYVAPSHKKSVANIIYGGCLFLSIFVLFISTDDWFEIILPVLGMTTGLYYVESEENENKE